MNEADTPTTPAGATLVSLTAMEARVLGCLMEKAVTTPDAYPLTLNALQLACNQKTNREPVMHAEIGEVGHALHTLEQKKLARVVHGARALRYEHTADSTLGLTARARAVIALLLLRGPQTQAELLSRSERLADFPDPAILGDMLQRLIERDPALITCVGRSSGQREDRYMHLLSGPVRIEHPAVHEAEPALGGDDHRRLEARVEVLERSVMQLRQALGIDDSDQT